MHVAEIELYEILKGKIGEKEARTLVEYIETKVDRELEERKDFLATKQDIARLELKMESIRSDLELKIEGVRSDLKLKIESSRSDLELKIESSRADIIKWMFLFWIGQVATLFAILQLFFRK